MKIELLYKTKETPAGAIKVHKCKTIKEAMDYYNAIKDGATKAYLRRFDGWNWYIHKTLK